MKLTLENIVITCTFHMNGTYFFFIATLTNMIIISTINDIHTTFA
jgi:hypothetical protein